MNIWVEYYKDRNNINKRFFDYMKDAKIFAKRMADEGYMVSIKRDGMLL